MSKAEIIKTIFLPVGPKIVWGYLTEPDQLAKWFHAPKVALAENEEYILYGVESGDKVCWGKVTEMTPHSALAYTFYVKPAPEVETQVKFTLDEVEGGTRLMVRHTGLENAGEPGFGLLYAFDKGWDEHFGRMRDISA